jgi:phage-related tail fiber protein
MLGFTTRGQHQDPAAELEFERFYARLNELLRGIFDEDGDLLPSTGAVPVGAIVEWGTATPPSGWLILDGAAVSRTTYQALFELWGTTYGAGNGSTTFNLRDDSPTVTIVYAGV